MLAVRRSIFLSTRTIVIPSLTNTSLSSLQQNRTLYVPRVTEKRPREQGPGGRSSNAGVTVAIFGASGFLGRYLCCNNGTNGVLTYVGNRGDEFEMRYLNPMFDLGRLRKVFYSSKDRDSMAEVIADADIVVNLIGQYYDTRALSTKASFPYLHLKTNTSIDQANVDVPRVVAELCKEMQVDNLIHVSALGAKEDSSSEFLRAKWKGEQAVRETYPWATVVRPAAMFGHEDLLLNWFASVAELLPFIPLVDGGHALTQPVYVGDVADAISKVIDVPEIFEGRTIEVFGPQDFSYKELAGFVYDITGQTPSIIDMPKEMLKKIAEILPRQRQPMLTRGLVEQWSEDVVASMTADEYAAQAKNPDGILTLATLGFRATPIEKIAFSYLHRFRRGGHFLITEGYHSNK